MDKWGCLVTTVVLCAVLESFHGLPLHADPEAGTPDSWQVGASHKYFLLYFNKITLISLT